MIKNKISWVYLLFIIAIGLFVSHIALGNEPIIRDDSFPIPVLRPSEFSGFSCPPNIAAAAFCGKKDEAAALFTYSWKPYWHEPFGMTSEYQLQSYGSYITTFGSLLQNTLLGLTGLRIQKGDWRKFNCTLPSNWDKIEIERIWINGKPVKIIAEDGKPARMIDLSTN